MDPLAGSSWSAPGTVAGFAKSAPNAVLTPHSAAFTREGSLKMAMAMAQNILDFLDDRLDRNMVFNFEALNDAPALGSIA